MHSEKKRSQGQQVGESTRDTDFFVPAVDIYESGKQVTVIAEMPGVNTTGVEVTLEDDVLTIKGNRTRKEHDARLILQEYETGDYLRRFTVAETIDRDKIQASMANGLLKVILPKAAPASPRRIEVKVG